MMTLFSTKNMTENMISIVIGAILTYGCYQVAWMLSPMSDPPTLVEVFGVFFNFVCVWLAVKENPWSWIHGAIGAILFGILFFQVSLFSSMALNLIYFLPLQFVGLYYWIYGGQNKTQLEISYTTTKNYIVSTAIMSIALVLWGLFLSAYTDAVYVVIDSLILGMSIVAQYYLARKYVESWYIWAMVNVLSVGLYWSVDAKVVAVQYFVFLCHAAWGIMRWTAKEKLNAKGMQLLQE